MSRILVSQIGSAIIIVLSFIFCGMTIAATKSSDKISGFSWSEHLDLIAALLSLLFTALVWFIVRTVKLIDKNQSELWSQINQVKKDFYELQGEHNMCCGNKR